MVEERDNLIKEALALVIESSAASESDENGRRDIKTGVKSTQELLEWQQRLDEEMKDFDASEALIEGRRRVKV